MNLRQSDSGFITLLLTGIIINDFTTKLLEFFSEEFVFSSPFLSQFKFLSNIFGISEQTYSYM